jgi:hypothetical protein
MPAQRVMRLVAASPPRARTEIEPRHPSHFWQDSFVADDQFRQQSFSERALRWRTEADVQAAVTTACGFLKGVVTGIQNAIKSEQEILRGLIAQLQTAESHSSPDPTQISQIQQSIATLRAQIDTDQANLDAAQDDYEAKCGSSQPPGGKSK